MAGEFAISLPRPEEMTKAVVGVGVGMVTGLAEGIVLSMAPALGALQTVATWGTLLGVPILGIVGALLTKGMLGDAFNGVAVGGSAVFGYSLPAMLKPYLPTAGGARQLAGQGVRQLPAGASFIPQRAQEVAARMGIEF